MNMVDIMMAATFDSKEKKKEKFGHLTDKTPLPSSIYNVQHQHC